MAVHFVGFKGDEFIRATRIWGEPDFIHRWHDHRMYGDVDEDDIIVFANKESSKKVQKYTWQDHELW